MAVKTNSVCHSNSQMNNELCNILGISTSASTDEIHAAFRKKARQHHPDLGGDRQEFQQINDAYEELLRQKEAAKSVSIELPLNSTQPPQPNSYQTTFSNSQTGANRASPEKPEKFGRSAKHLLTGNLPLRDQTTYFILVNALDIFLTYLHLRSGNYEANPIAAFFIDKWNVLGMVGYKMSIVAVVCVIAQIVALKSLQKASRLLIFGTVFISCVVLYSIWLLAK